MIEPTRTPKLKCHGNLPGKRKCPARKNCWRYRSIARDGQNYVMSNSISKDVQFRCSLFIFKGSAQPLRPMTKSELELLGGGV